LFSAFSFFAMFSFRLYNRGGVTPASAQSNLNRCSPYV
jgi:hypothetical protein